MSSDPVPVRELVRYFEDLGWDLNLPDLPAATRRSGEGASATDCHTLEELERWLDGCPRCRLSQTRNRIVFGDGDPGARLMFVGEAPGREEDRTGKPFVGQAGKLLDAMIFALGLRREDVYIGNVLKCRPPNNRDPQPDEVAACAPVLDRQIELISPEVIVCLGVPAVRRLLGTNKPMKALRGRWFSYGSANVTATYHPAYLLRNATAKRDAWDDLKKIGKRLGEPR